jgi:hypothetical protein
MLSAAQIADIRGSLAGAPIFDATDRVRTLNAPGTADAAIIGYPIPVVLGCPHLLELANEPRLLTLVGAYLGCKPTIITWGLLRSRPAIGSAAITQKFHRDREGWRSVKLFVYLTDVDEVAGPHMYACGSHRTRSSLRARCYSDAEVAARTGPQTIDTITGEAGFGFLADTFGLHKGESPAARERLILQIHYACVPSPLYIYGPLRLSGPSMGLIPTSTGSSWPALTSRKLAWTHASPSRNPAKKRGSRQLRNPLASIVPTLLYSRSRAYAAGLQPAISANSG